MFKNAFTFILGAAIGAAAYHVLTKAVVVVVETVTETVAS